MDFDERKALTEQFLAVDPTDYDKINQCLYIADALYQMPPMQKELYGLEDDIPMYLQHEPGDGFGHICNAVLLGNNESDLCYTLTKYNLKELYPFGDYLMRNYNIMFFGVNRYLPVGKGLFMRNSLEPSVREFNTSIKEIKKLKEKYSIETYITDGFPYCLLEDKDLQEYVSSCSAGVDFCNIDSQGNVKLCPATDYIVGNLYDTSLEDIWQNNELLNNYRSLTWVPEECREDKDAYKCLFGCKISANYSL